MADAPFLARFVTEYLRDEHAHHAAVRAGASFIDWPAPRFYVYALVEPSGRIFYIGKGTKNRHKAHQRLGVRHPNPNVMDIAARLALSGEVWQSVCLAADLTEADAFALERSVIHAIGPARLANMSTPLAKAVKDARWARAMLKRVIDPDDLPEHKWMDWLYIVGLLLEMSVGDRPMKQATHHG